MLLRAGIALARGDRGRATEQYAAAEGAFVAVDMTLHAAAARRRRGEALGPDKGERLIGSADAAFLAQGVRDPRRIVAMLAPAPPPATSPPTILALSSST
jgi:hypothetical protein